MENRKIVMKSYNAKRYLKGFLDFENVLLKWNTFNSMNFGTYFWPFNSEFAALASHFIVSN